MGTRFGLAEQLCAASRAEPPVHHVAAVGDATIIARRSVDGEGRRGEADVDRTATRSEILTNAAPAQTRDDWFRRGFVSDLSAQTATRNCHVPPPHFAATTTPVAHMVQRSRNLACAKDLFSMRDRATAGDSFRGGDLPSPLRVHVGVHRRMRGQIWYRAGFEYRSDVHYSLGPWAELGPILHSLAIGISRLREIRPIRANGSANLPLVVVPGRAERVLEYVRKLGAVAVPVFGGEVVKECLAVRGLGVDSCP